MSDIDSVIETIDQLTQENERLKLRLSSVSGCYSELKMKAAFEAGVYYERSCEDYSKQPKVTMAGHLVSNQTPDFSEFMNNLNNH